ncbi:MAG: CHASE2 domain-containing protein [Pseudomonadota bacterium]
MLERFHTWLAGTTERRILILAALLMLLPTLKPGSWASLDDMTFRAAAKFSAKFAKKPDIVIAAIGDHASEIGRAIDQLDLLNARLIVIDPGIPLLKSNTKIIRGYEFYPNLSDLPPDYAKTGGERALYEAYVLALPSAPSRDFPLRSMAGIDLNAVRGTEKRTASDGFSNIFPDADGIVRHAPLAVRLRHRAFPSLALSAAAEALGFTPLIVEDASGKPKGIMLGQEIIDVPSDTNATIGFKGKAGFFPRVTLEDIAESRVDVDGISNKIVIIGYIDPENAPMFKTPMGKMPAVEILASSLQNILWSESIRPLTDLKWTMLTLLIVLALYALIVLRFGLAARVIVTGLAIALVWAITLPLFLYTGILLPAVHFSIYALALLFISIAWRVFVIEIPRMFRMRTFQMRIAPDMLDKALRTPGTIISHGTTHTITALAIDIRGYGLIASKTPAERLCPFMREYRTALARLLIKYGAFIDSWAGDECRAVFGAILPQEEHQLIACRAAFHILKSFSQAREEISKRYGIERLSLSMGITSGAAAVGNLGPRGVSDINVTGQAMELACTLRALNRTYRTAIIVDDAVKAEAENYFSFRPLDPLLYGAQDKLITIYEFLGKTGIILPQLPQYLEAREAYLKGDFERATHLFSLILAEHPHDGPSQVLLKRSRVLANTPPKSEWKGAWQSP